MSSVPTVCTGLFLLCVVPAGSHSWCLVSHAISCMSVIVLVCRDSVMTSVEMPSSRDNLSCLYYILRYFISPGHL